MKTENLESRLGLLSAAVQAYVPPVRRDRQGVWADLDFTSGGPYKVGEKVEYGGGSNIQVEKGEPAGLYLFVIYVFGSDSTGRLFYEHAASYPVVANGTDISGYSPIIHGAVFPSYFGPYLGPGQYSFTVVIRVIKPNTNKEEELARQVSSFIIESGGRGGDGPIPLLEVGVRVTGGGDGPSPLWFGPGDGGNPLDLGIKVSVGDRSGAAQGEDRPDAVQGRYQIELFNDTGSDVYLRMYGPDRVITTRFARSQSPFLIIGSRHFGDGDYVYAARTVMGDVAAWGRVRIGPEVAVLHFNAGSDQFGAGRERGTQP